MDRVTQLNYYIARQQDLYHCRRFITCASDGGPAGPSATITAPALPLILSTYVVVTAAGLKPPPSFHKGRKLYTVNSQQLYYL
jgi:hypothetical protein